MKPTFKMEFKLDEFLENPSLEEFGKLRKAPLVEIGEHFGLDVKMTMRKQELKNTVIQGLVDEEVFGEEALSEIKPVPGAIDPLALKQMELAHEFRIKQLEREKEEQERRDRLEREEKEREERERERRERAEREEKERRERAEREEKEREREQRNRELREKELEIQREIRLKEIEAGLPNSTTHPPSGTNFDAAKNIRLVPKFQEKEVDKYFQHFEKIATSLHWPKNVWALMLQSVLVGKASETFSALPLDTSGDYELVKKAILKAYELVPEAYRQKFRTAKKQYDQTHVEFAHDKEQLFDKWLTSKNVDKDFDKLRQLMLIEEFKQCIHSDIKTHLDEHKIDNLNEAATMADDYAITHKLSFSKFNSNVSNRPGQARAPYFNKQNFNKTNDGKPKPWSSEKVTNVTHKPQEQKPETFKPGPMCSYCKKKGHLISECWLLQKKEDKNKSFPNAFSVKQSPVHNFVAKKPEILEERSESEEIMEEFKPFVSEGFVSLIGEEDNLQPIKILRDTAASQTLILEGVLPFSQQSSVDADVLVEGVDLQYINVPLHNVNLKSDIVSGPVTVGIRPSFPVKGISMLLGNDLAGTKVVPDPIVSKQPCLIEEVEEDSKIYPACAVTRAMSKKLLDEDQNTQNFEIDTDEQSGLEGTFLARLNEEESNESKDVPSVNEDKKGHDKDPLTRDKLIVEQKRDPVLVELCSQSLSQQEAEKVPVCFYMKDGVLMRKWRPPDVGVEEEWKVVHQIVVPKVYRQEVISIAHDHPMSGHLGVTKTYNRILNHFYWPQLRKDVAEYCKSCHTCQMVGKPNQKPPVATLHPIPAFDEPFSRVIIDCVGPLPKTRSGNQYLLTIMCASTRFPEAIPLRDIKAPKIVKALTKFFTFVGLPKEIQSDQGSNFMSNLFQQVMHELGIKQFKSSAYHPESQGALERFHQTLKNMIRTFCLEYDKDWDEGVHLLLFAAREAVQESLGFSPFELVFGHTVRGPLKLLKEKWLCEEPDINLLDYVACFKEKLTRATEIARQNLKQSQSKMKQWYDKDAKNRIFNPGDKVLVFFPIPGHPLQARYDGPYEIEKKVSDTDYIVKTPGRRKQRQLCHVNMLKEYVERGETSTPKPVSTLSTAQSSVDENVNENVNVNVNENLNVNTNVNVNDNVNDDVCNMKLKNSDVLNDLDDKLKHLSYEQRNELKDLMFKYKNLFPDVPTKTNLVYHDVDVNGATPVKQHPYRVNPIKLEIMRKEIKYMLENDIIEPSDSEWSSPSLLVPKPDNAYRFCTDFRTVNSFTKTDSFPIPRCDDCIDKIGKAKFVTKIDLLKGYWQIPLTERAKEVSAFVTPDGLYQYKVMAFGMKNAPATFQRLVNSLIADIEDCEGYIDDIIVYSETWEQHVQQLEKLFQKLSKAQLTVNLMKSDFCHATVQYLGHVVGQGQTKPVMAKVEAIVEFPAPTNKRELMRFLGMAGYYRKYCPNFSTVANPMTELLKKGIKFEWSLDCQKAFDKIKAILISSPVLATPNFTKQFKLIVDASDIGAGAILMQEGTNQIDYPVCYFSKKFNTHQKNYSTIEKECLALVLALQHFEVYLSTTLYPVLVFTDHNPLTFINKMKNKNQRLVRWSLALQEYNLEIRHIKGKDNIADALSRAG